MYSGTSLALIPTLPGDANVDGNLDFADLVALAQHYNTSGTFWQEADFTCDGLTDFADLVVLAQHDRRGLGRGL